MDVNKQPEILERGMYQATGVNASAIPEISQENDIDAPFSDSSSGTIPQYLQDIIQSSSASVDPEPEVVEQVEGPSLDAEKVAEENPQSRFRILDVAIHKPGVCALCGSAGGDGRQFIDFGKTMDWYGVVYFCTFCVSEAAKLMGLGNIEVLREILEVRSETYQKTLYANTELREKLDAAMVLLRNCTCVDSGVAAPAKEFPEAELIEPESFGVGDESPNSDESDVDESASEQGSDDVSADSSDVESEPSPRRTRRTKSDG